MRRGAESRLDDHCEDVGVELLIRVEARDEALARALGQLGRGGNGLDRVVRVLLRTGRTAAPFVDG
eukprot:805024-Pleurochrysis_carterae.AAC.2